MSRPRFKWFGLAAGAFAIAASALAMPPSDAPVISPDDALSLFDGLFDFDGSDDPALADSGLRILRATDRAADEIASASAAAMNKVETLKNPGPRRTAAAIRSGEASIRAAMQQSQARLAAVVQQELSKFDDLFSDEVIAEIVSGLKAGLVDMRSQALNDLRSMGRGATQPKAGDSAAVGTYTVFMSDPTGRFENVPVARLTLNDDFSVRGSTLVARAAVAMFDQDAAIGLIGLLGERTPVRGYRWMERGGRVQIVGPVGRSIATTPGTDEEFTVQGLSVLWSITSIIGEDELAGDDLEAINDEFGSVSDWISTFTYRLVKRAQE